MGTEREALQSPQTDQREQASAPTSRPVTPRRAPVRRLAVGAADDPAEREADAVAQHVTAMLRQQATDPIDSAFANEPTEGASRIRRSSNGAGVSRPVVGPEGGIVDSELAGRIRSAGGGRALDPAARTPMESAFGTSFGDVRIHTDSGVTPELGARAFTLGADIHFAPGEYRPQSSDHARTLAHELAHVVQQRGRIQPSGVARIVSPAADGEVIRRLMLPAYVKEDAGIHKFETPAGTTNEVIKPGGMRRKGILADIPADTLVMYDGNRQSPSYVKVTHNGQTGYVNRDHLIDCQRIGTSQFYAIEIRNKNYVSFYDAVAGTYFTDATLPTRKDEVIANLTAMLSALAGAESTTKLTVRDKCNVVDNVLHQYALGAPVDPGLWPLAAANLAVVKQRVQHDNDDLVRAGLITRLSVLESVAFTGADFHKEGQAPLFLRFRDVITDETSKIVYKPSDLSVDRAIFGKRLGGRGAGVAETLDPTGNYASRYTILTREDAGHQKYGYMEFVKSGTPQNAADMTNVYRSLAANMAVSYLVGLEDVHDENVLLLKDRVQVIDMEATTGAFKIDPNDLTSGGFDAMLWPKAINGKKGLSVKLRDAAKNKVLTAVPATATVRTEMTSAFKAALSRAASAKDTVGAQADELADQKSRIVPLATENFYRMIDPAKEAGSLTNWRAKVNGDAALVAQANGQSGHTDAFVRRVLRSRGAYESLIRGEVPYFSRDLGSTDIFDERGTRIDSTGCSKISGPIDVAMKGRREHLGEKGFKKANKNVTNVDVMKMFKTQILDGLIGPLNDQLAIDIAAAAAG